MSQLAEKQLDSLARFSVSEAKEQTMCVERFTIVEEPNGHRTVTLQRLGRSPLAWVSDSVNIWAPPPLTHLCYAGQPVVHTHSNGADRPSQQDFITAFQYDHAPFAVILATQVWFTGRIDWSVTLYAVRP